LVGNEDVGQMSAWYVLASGGIHPVTPGATRYEITSPMWEKTEFKVDGGKVFTVIARNNSPANVYIQSAKLNSMPYDKCWIDYATIMSGATLELELGAAPNPKWGEE